MPAADGRSPAARRTRRTQSLQARPRRTRGHRCVHPEPGGDAHTRAPAPAGSLPATALRRRGRSCTGWGAHRAAARTRPWIESYLRQIVPGIHGVASRATAGREILEFTQDVPGTKAPWRFAAPSVSDGTLRALGVLVSLFNTHRQCLQHGGDRGPETALHPTANLLRCSPRCGMPATAVRSSRPSHSPDSSRQRDLEPSELRAVRATRRTDGSSRPSTTPATFRAQRPASHPRPAAAHRPTPPAPLPAAPSTADRRRRLGPATHLVAARRARPRRRASGGRPGGVPALAGGGHMLPVVMSPPCPGRAAPGRAGGCA